MESRRDLDELESQINDLTCRKSECAMGGEYNKAEKLKIEIEKLEKILQKRKIKELELSHAEEIENLENIYRQEVENFNTFWDKQLSQFEEQSNLSESAIKEKHDKEGEELIDTLTKKIPNNVKVSKMFLELKMQENNLVKQQRYKEAMFIKKKADQLEYNDSIKSNKDKNEKLQSNGERLKTKQNNELNALRKKIEIQKEIMRKEKETGLQNILHRYKNKKFELESQQKKEKSMSENPNLNKLRNSVNPKTTNRKFATLTAKNEFNSEKVNSSENKYEVIDSDTKDVEIA